MMLRDFIHDRLYGSPGGYFTKDSHQVGRLREPIKFSRLRGYFDFRQEMERLYPENQWITPVELFKPYYGYTIANFILNQMENRKQKKLRVIEIGPGTGTMADSLLDFFKNYNLDIYRECEYVFIEISPQLAETCEKLMIQNHKQLWDNNKIKIFNGSILEFNKKVSPGQLSFVVGLEVLDNMPHDKLYFNDQGTQLTHQAMVKVEQDENGNETLEDVKEEINDELCQLFAELYKTMPSKDHISANKILKQEGFFKRLQEMINIMKYKDSMINNIFAPTQALRMIKHINQFIPDHCLIMADFDSFIYPKNSIKGINAPLVTNKLKDPTQWKTYDHYLIPRGEADICFPVDFFFLKHAYQKITGYNANVHKTSEFVDLYSLKSWCTTQNMYNPMQEEYFNTSFLLSYVNVLQSFQAMHAQHPGGLNPTAFTSVRDSRENLFASNLMPLPPKFTFQERTGRINWRALMNTDLDKVAKEIDLKALESLLQNLTFAQLDRDDLERLGDAHFIKLFRLSQYSIEYLLYTQNYLESLCKTLDIEYRQTYEKTAKTEEAIKKYQQELKIMRKELKLKQKTLSTYEYLMKLPAEQEQDVIKCKHCSKFFLSKGYLQKHYQRHHPEIDFYREFSDLPNDKSLNDRASSPVTQKQPQINQEELFNKIKGELFTSLADNFKKIEHEILTLKEKQNYKQIQDMLQNYEHKNEEEQKKIQESLQKPAKMLEELKGRWGDMFQQQTSTMKDLISQSVNDALAKRKEEREKKKQNSHNKSGELSDSVQDQKVKYFEQRINEFDEKFKENEKVKSALEQKVKEYERLLQEKAQYEEQMKLKLQDEEQKRKEEERLRKEKEQELMKQLSQQAQEELKMKLAEEELQRTEQERKQKEEQDKLMKEQEEERKLLQQKQEAEELEKQKKLLEQQELEIKQKEEEEMKALLKKQQEEEERKRREQEELKKKQEEAQKEEEEEEEVEVIEIEEEQEEEDSDIDAELKKKEELKKEQSLQKQPSSEGKPMESKRDKLRKALKEELEADNIYEGSNAQIKSIFKHDAKEVEAKLNDIKAESYVTQDNILQQEFQLQKIQVVDEKSNPLTTTRKDDLRDVHEMIKGLNRRDVGKINNSLQKRLSDQAFSKYNGLIDGFLRKALK